MPVDPELLEILGCPENHQPVQPAGADLLDRLNEQISAGELRTRGGEARREPLAEALLREDGRILYPVEDGIPVMLIEESVELSAPSDSEA